MASRAFLPVFHTFVTIKSTGKFHSWAVFDKSNSKRKMLRIYSWKERIGLSQKVFVNAELMIYYIIYELYYLI